MEEELPIIPAHVADGPAQLMSMNAWDRHLSESVIIESRNPRINLTQGSWVRVSRANVMQTLRMLMGLADGGEAQLTVRDSVTAASLRRQTLLTATECPTCRQPLLVTGVVKVCPNECFIIVGEQFYFRDLEDA